jgi:hypothetical protein
MFDPLRAADQGRIQNIFVNVFPEEAYIFSDKAFPLFYDAFYAFADSIVVLFIQLRKNSACAKIVSSRFFCSLVTSRCFSKARLSTASSVTPDILGKASIIRLSAGYRSCRLGCPLEKSRIKTSNPKIIAEEAIPRKFSPRLTRYSKGPTIFVRTFFVEINYCGS